MDVAAARTFLEIVKTGSFAQAANNLHFTQTAIGARVKVLEDQLGEQLFVRSKAGAHLTPAGQQFLRYASSFVQIWEQARRAVSLPAGHDMVVSIGSELVAYRPMLLRWVEWMRTQHPTSQILVRIENAERLVGLVRDGALDAAMLYGASAHAGLVSEILVEERLVLARTLRPQRELGPEDHVGIDWGADFAIGYQAAFPTMPPPRVHFNHGPVALEYLLGHGGTAYLRTSIAMPLVEQRQVELVAGAPEFPYSIFLIHSTRADEGTIRIIREGLRAIAG